MSVTLLHLCAIALISLSDAVAVGQQYLRGQANATQSQWTYTEGSDLDLVVNDVKSVYSANVSQAPATQPRVFFLFLTMSGVKRPELWKAFLDEQSTTVGVHTLSRVFIHCVHSHICSADLANNNMLGATQVATVPSTYCKDLVSPMVQLLQGAVLESANPNDKFVFLSETTLPAKPFFDVYSKMTADTSSDFCIYPTDHWVQLELAQNLRALIVKHSQWMVLSQEHAKTMVAAWPSLKQSFNGYTWQIPVYHESKKGPWGKITNPAGILPLPMCVDEWAFFGTIYGAFVDQGQMSLPVDALPGFAKPPLKFRDFAGASQATTVHQGNCRTFAFWDAEEVGESNMMTEIAQDWPWTKFTCFPKCDSSHPAEFAALSDRGAIALRKSRYLFARKFMSQVMTVDQFKRIILSKVVPASTPAQAVASNPYHYVQPR